MCGTLDYFIEEKSHFEEPIWYKAPESRICSSEEIELTISAFLFPFEVGGVESLEAFGTLIFFFLSRFSNSSIPLVLQWCSSWFCFFQYAQNILSFLLLFPFLLEEELPTCEEEDCCVSNCDFCFHCFFLLLVELFSPWFDWFSLLATNALVFDDVRILISINLDCYNINISMNASSEGLVNALRMVNLWVL